MIKSVSARITQLVLLTLVVAGALGINYLAAWTGPTALPPNSNAPAPITTSGTPQVKNGNLSVGASGNTSANLGLTVYGSQSTTGDVRSSGEFQNTLSGYGNLRMIGGSYGAFFRNDGANTYFLFTAAGDQYGTWNGLRPLYINDVTGQVNLDNGVTVRGTGVTFPDGTVQTTAASGGGSAKKYCPMVDPSKSFPTPQYIRCGTATAYSIMSFADITSGQIHYKDSTLTTPCHIYYNSTTGAYASYSIANCVVSAIANCQQSLTTIAADALNRCDL